MEKLRIEKTQFLLFLKNLPTRTSYNYNEKDNFRFNDITF